jgi:hypothetical protein
MSESNGRPVLDLDSQEESPELKVVVSGFTIVIDLLNAHCACILATTREKKGATVEECIPAIRAYLTDKIREQDTPAPNQTMDPHGAPITISDTQCFRFYWHLVQQMEAFEKKVLPASMQRPASHTFTDSTPGAAVR